MAATITYSPKPFLRWLRNFALRKWNYLSLKDAGDMNSGVVLPHIKQQCKAPRSRVMGCWKNLTHTLSGLFCASVNFLESSTAYSAPKWAFRLASGNLRYGTLPCEAVCTENLTPWWKLLPCRDNSGPSALMDRPSVYRGYYHSQRLHLISTEFDSDGVDTGIVLEQTLAVVFQPNGWKTSKNYAVNTNMQPNWSVSSIFGRKVSGKCILAKSSNVYLQLDEGLVHKLKNLHKENAEYGANNLASEHSFELSVNPDKVYEEMDNLHGKSTPIMYAYSVDKYNDSQPFDLGLTLKFPVVWLSQQAPLHARRFLMGNGNERGAIAISLRSTDLNEGSESTNAIDKGCELQVDIFHVVPWYIKVYFHALQVYVNQQAKAVADVEKRYMFHLPKTVITWDNGDDAEAALWCRIGCFNYRFR